MHETAWLRRLGEGGGDAWSKTRDRGSTCKHTGEALHALTVCPPHRSGMSGRAQPLACCCQRERCLSPARASAAVLLPRDRAAASLTPLLKQPLVCQPETLLVTKPASAAPLCQDGCIQHPPRRLRCAPDTTHFGQSEPPPLPPTEALDMSKFPLVAPRASLAAPPLSSLPTTT